MLPLEESIYSTMQMCCFLTSYFNSLLPTKRNIITHLDCLLVLTITILTSEMVSAPPFKFLLQTNFPFHRQSPTPFYMLSDPCPCSWRSC